MGLTSKIIGIILILFAAVWILGPDKRRITDGVRASSGSDFIELSEGFVEFESAGPVDGEPVVLIHGLSVPMYDWDGQFENLADNGYRVVRYNQFGRGLSDRPRGVYSLDRYVRQLRELMESQGWDKANIIGHSMGGVIAAGYAEAFPESVDRVVLISPGLHMAKDNSGITLIRIPVLGDLAAKTVLPSILTNRAEGLFLNAGAAEADRYSQAFRRQIRYAGFSRSVKSLFRHDVVDDRTDTYEALGAFETLLIHGTNDESVPTEHFDIITEKTSAERIVLPGIGHMPNMEAPDKVNSQIVGFLRD